MEGRREVTLTVLVGVLAGLLALVSARDQAGAWNDASRLATVEALVDHRTWAIDDSIFAGTKDKLFIDGRYYSDKSPVPALYLGGVYQVYRWLGGAAAADDSARFVWLMTLASAGLAYLIAVMAIFLLGRLLGLPPGDRLFLTASFALATVAPVYAQYVNNHILFLGAAGPLVVVLTMLAGEPGPANRKRFGILLIAGTLTGIGYTIDLGVGPVLVACTLGLVLHQCRHWQSATLFLLAALPWLALHHAFNYAIGGTWKPANANPEFFLWPGCPFRPDNMTGGWNHTPLHFVTYALQMLVGNRGFLGHNPALFLAAAVPFLLFRQSVREKPVLVWAMAWSVLTWMMYAATSNNYSGQCCTIRWFVPLLAPGYLLLAVLLRERPRFRGDLIYLSIWGAFLAGMMCLEGPWMKRMVPYYWGWQGLMLLGYVCLCFCRRGVEVSLDGQVTDRSSYQQAA